MAARYCMQCGRQLAGDEIALYRKLVWREATSYKCLDCLADDLSVTRQRLESLIDYYRRSGTCCLFVGK